MKQYSQETTLVLTEAMTCSLLLALEHRLDCFKKESGDDCLKDAHPNSYIGNVNLLAADLRKVRLGDKSTSVATYKMVRNP
jgi:hypothetical protein